MKSAPASVVERATTLRAEGLSYADIGLQLGYSASAVCHWLKGDRRSNLKRKYDSDPEYREKLNNRQNEWARKKRRNDPDYRKRRNELHRVRVRNWKKTLPGRVGTALAMSKAMAKRKGHVPCTATKESLVDAWQSQKGRCKICGVHESECDKRFHLDHNHQTGEFRGWLCRSCNTALGLLGDDPLIAAKRLAEYAECG